MKTKEDICEAILRLPHNEFIRLSEAVGAAFRAQMHSLKPNYAILQDVAQRHMQRCPPPKSITEQEFERRIKEDFEKDFRENPETVVNWFLGGFLSEPEIAAIRPSDTNSEFVTDPKADGEFKTLYEALPPWLQEVKDTLDRREDSNVIFPDFGKSFDKEV